MGLSAIVSSALYFALADPGQSTIGSFQNLLVAVLAAAVYTLINIGSLALIVAPVMGISPFEMWRINSGGLHVELLTLVTLGSLIPVLVSENPLSIVLLIVPLLLGPRLAFKGIRQAHHEARVAMEGLANALERRDAVHLPSTPFGLRSMSARSLAQCRRFLVQRRKQSSLPRMSMIWVRLAPGMGL